jgi:hypothetical protein
LCRNVGKVIKEIILFAATGINSLAQDSNGNIQWKCEAELEDFVKFGDLTVECEGISLPSA